MTLDLLMLSKSTWEPAIRREHSFVEQACLAGLSVVFIEAPQDIRAVRSKGGKQFFRELRGKHYPVALPGVSSIRRSVFVPGHRGLVAQALDCFGLRRHLNNWKDSRDLPIVCMTPWQWTASRLHSGRRIFDCADDWTKLMPASREGWLLQIFRQIAIEADEIIVASPDLAPLFPGREVRIVPNGTSPLGIAQCASSPPRRGRLGYVGTLSERFDHALVAEVLRSSPHYSLDLWGECHYAHCGDKPSPELSNFFAEFTDRVRLNGLVSRPDLAAAIDSVDVLIVPNKKHLSRGQSSMKLYDIAGRGRPVVASPGVAAAGDQRPPHLYEAQTSSEWVLRISQAMNENHKLAAERIHWASRNTWVERWPNWWEIVSARSARADRRP